jgi:hypothetical protein
MKPKPTDAVNEELRAAIRRVNHGGIDKDGSTDTDRLEALIAQEANKSQKQLLNELIDQKWTAGKIEPITGLRQDVDWLPISVIQNKLEGLS